MNKVLSLTRSNAQRALAAASLFALTSSVAMAQAVDPFTTAVTEATAKITTYAGALVGVAAIGVVFMIAIKYVKKIKGAA